MQSVRNALQVQSIQIQNIKNIPYQKVFYFNETQNSQQEHNFVPIKKQIVCLEDKDIDSIVPIEKKIIEYIPIQTIIQKEPILVEIPYEVYKPKPYQQDLTIVKEPNFYFDKLGNPIYNLQQFPQQDQNEDEPLKQNNFEADLMQEDKESLEDEDQELEILWRQQRIIEEKIETIQDNNRRKRKRQQKKIRHDSDDDFDFSTFENLYENENNHYRDQESRNRSEYGLFINRRCEDRYREQFPADYGRRYQRIRGYHGKDRSAQDYM